MLSHWPSIDPPTILLDPLLPNSMAILVFSSSEDRVTIMAGQDRSRVLAKSLVVRPIYLSMSNPNQPSPSETGGQSLEWMIPEVIETPDMPRPQIMKFNEPNSRIRKKALVHEPPASNGPHQPTTSNRNQGTSNSRLRPKPPSEASNSNPPTTSNRNQGTSNSRLRPKPPSKASNSNPMTNPGSPPKNPRNSQMFTSTWPSTASPNPNDPERPLPPSSMFAHMVKDLRRNK